MIRRGLREGVVEELSRDVGDLYHAMSAVRGPDFPAPALKWVLTAFIRRCVFDFPFSWSCMSREAFLRAYKVSALIRELQDLVQEAVERKDVRAGVIHYLEHADHALYALKNCTALGEKTRQEAEALRGLISIIKLRFQLVCDGKEPLCYALPALEDTVLAWYGLYCKD